MGAPPHLLIVLAIVLGLGVSGVRHTLVQPNSTDLRFGPIWAQALGERAHPGKLLGLTLPITLVAKWDMLEVFIDARFYFLFLITSPFLC